MSIFFTSLAKTATKLKSVYANGCFKDARLEGPKAGPGASAGLGPDPAHQATTTRRRSKERDEKEIKGGEKGRKGRRGVKEGVGKEREETGKNETEKRETQKADPHREARRVWGQVRIPVTCTWLVQKQK